MPNFGTIQTDVCVCASPCSKVGEESEERKGQSETPPPPIKNTECVTLLRVLSSWRVLKVSSDAFKYKINVRKKTSFK